MNRFLLLLFLGTATLCCWGKPVEDYAAEVKRDYPILLEQWRKGMRDADLEDRLYRTARDTGHLETIEELWAGKAVASLEIKVPGAPKVIPARAIRSFEDPQQEPYRGNPFVIRRMTDKRFEVWTFQQGWLFDQSGHLLNKAKPPRRDGWGREWYGAFLPDGCWVTTDLGEFDCCLTFFTREGKWRKEIRCAGLIGWCRCDKKGRGFVASIGSEEGRALVFMTPDGKTRPLTRAEPWSLCFPRDLEAKGYFILLYRPSDDGKLWLYRNEPGHGSGVGFPSFTWCPVKPQSDIFAYENKPQATARIVNGTHNFGFLPNSHTAFIDADVFYDDQDKEEPAPAVRKDCVPTKCWFFSPQAVCLGWVNAHYLCDSDKGKTVWLVNDAGEVLQLTAGLKPKQRLAFTIDGKPARPEKLFTDLHLGFFHVNNRLVLAKW